MKDIFLKLMFTILTYCMNFIMVGRGEKLVANLHDKTEYYTHRKYKPSIKS